MKEVIVKDAALQQAAEEGMDAFLQVFVKVEPNWREDKKMLRKFGYIQD